ncbi:MAG TPA: FecR family protein [Steroidobacteraceae bacterium]|nr:FecR family protein [Steroidobacteraceae bacterium]
MSEREAAEQAAAAWISRRDAGDLTAEDAAGFEAWLAASLHHRVAYYRLHAAWKEAGRLAAMLPQKPALPVARQRPWLRHPLALAASVLLVLGVAFAIYWQVAGGAQVYVTEVGELRQVLLPDGSTVVLNTNSALRVDMRASERQLELQRGEAFFEVAKDASRPFVVLASKVRVVATGTAFAVQQQGPRMQVVVAEGSVRVDAAGQRAGPTSLGAGSMLQVAATDVLTRSLTDEEVEEHLSWRSGLVVFRDTPLAEAAAQFNRYNKRKIVLADPSIAELGVGGVFRATDQEVFLKLLETGFPVRAEMHKDEVLLHPRL